MKITLHCSLKPLKKPSKLDVAAVTKLMLLTDEACEIHRRPRHGREPRQTTTAQNHHPSQFTLPSPHDTLTRQFKPFLFPFCNNTFAVFSIYSILFFVYIFATEDPAKLAWRTPAFFSASALARPHITCSWRENR